MKPTDDLISEYTRRRAGLRGRDGEAIVRATDSALNRTARARETLLALRQSHRLGHVSSEQVPKLARTALEDAEKGVESDVAMARKVLGPMAEHHLDAASPRRHPRGAETSEAKADLDRRLGHHLGSEDLIEAIVNEIRRLDADGDPLARDLLLGDYGRDTLAGHGVPNADEVHASLRRSLIPEIHLDGDRAKALEAYRRVPDYEALVTIAHHATAMALKDLADGDVD